jgi:hypothetical protein
LQLDVHLREGHLRLGNQLGRAVGVLEYPLGRPYRLLRQMLLVCALQKGRAQVLKRHLPGALVPQHVRGITEQGDDFPLRVLVVGFLVES